MLEIGFGSGLNIPFHPNRAQGGPGRRPGSGGPQAGRATGRRVPGAGRVRRIRRLGALVGGASVDSVLSTRTLCMIPDEARALAEIVRVP